MSFGSIIDTNDLKKVQNNYKSISFVSLLKTDARKYIKDTSHPTSKLKPYKYWGTKKNSKLNADVHLANTDWVQGGQL